MNAGHVKGLAPSSPYANGDDPHRAGAQAGRWLLASGSRDNMVPPGEGSHGCSCHKKVHWWQKRSIPAKDMTHWLLSRAGAAFRVTFHHTYWNTLLHFAYSLLAADTRLSGQTV